MTGDKKQQVKAGTRPYGTTPSRRRFLGALLGTSLGVALTRNRRERAKKRLPPWIGHVS